MLWTTYYQQSFPALSLCQSGFIDAIHSNALFVAIPGIPLATLSAFLTSMPRWGGLVDWQPSGWDLSRPAVQQLQMIRCYNTFLRKAKHPSQGDHIIISYEILREHLRVSQLWIVFILELTYTASCSHWAVPNLSILKQDQGCLVQVGNDIELDTVSRQFEPYWWRPCGVT